MAETEAGRRPARSDRGPRAGRGTRRGGAETSREEDLDLLTAALIGLTVGVGVTMLFRRRPPVTTALSRGRDFAGRGARMAAAAAGTMADKARRGYDRGVEFADDSVSGIGEHLQDYFEAAKAAVEDTVSGELQDLRKSIRRRRRRLGI